MDRGHWGSRMAFVLAAAGSAIGLGNIWKFPYITYENGGGKFVVLYLVCILLVGLPVLVAEMLLGRHTEKSPVAAVEAISGENSPWKLMGFLGVSASFVVMSFYGVVAGWILVYVVLSLTGALAGLTAEQFSAQFGALYASPWLNVGGSTLFLLMSVAVVLGGVKGGLEKVCNILMPALIGLLVLLCINSVGAPNEGFSKAIQFLFSFDKPLEGHAILEALGHAFFTLSLGMGAMLTYGSYLDKRADIVKAALWVAALDTIIALMACIIIFSTLMAYDMEVGQSVGLVFNSLPLAFSKSAAIGKYLVAIFFILLFMAAWTSGISLLEVPTAYLIDKGMERKTATLTMAGLIWIVSIPCALSGSPEWKAVFKNFDFFDSMDRFSSQYMLPIGGLAIAIYVGYIISKKAREEEFFSGLEVPPIVYRGWMLLLRFVAPLIVVIILLNKVGFITDEQFNKSFERLFGHTEEVQHEPMRSLPVKKP